MPGAAEPAKSRAQPGSLDLLEADPAKHLRTIDTCDGCCVSGNWIGRTEGRVFRAD